VQKEALRFRVSIDKIDVLVPSNSCFHLLLSHVIVLNDYLVHFFGGLLLGSRFTTWRLTKHSWAPLCFALWIAAKLLCSFLCMLDTIVGLHATSEKMFNDFLIGKWKWILYVINEYLIQNLYFVYVVEAFIIWHWKAYYKYLSPFPSVPLVIYTCFPFRTSCM